jgi:hypothetical protein
MRERQPHVSVLAPELSWGSFPFSVATAGVYVAYRKVCLPYYVPFPGFLALLTAYSSPRLCRFITPCLRSWDLPFRVFTRYGRLLSSRITVALLVLRLCLIFRPSSRTDHVPLKSLLP